MDTAVAATNNEVETSSGGISGELSEVMYVPSKELDYDRWAQEVITLARMQRSSSWWLGDILLYGEEKFGERAWQVQDQLDVKYEYGTLADLKWVSKRVPPYVRHPKLSWSHHRQVAKLEIADQKAWLAKAAEGDDGVIWSRARFRQELQTAGVIKGREKEDCDPVDELIARVQALPEDDLKRFLVSIKGLYARFQPASNG